ncbi:unnamed protein product [Leptidea sinapis]|uniref:Armadillo repeat-containing domain-containing protein n=1 Tax=Leptidea sinapis TaxID=189913 RepID=A0A5E4PSA7_9NEOP|nr:unnamed protein product [Leptidea sinapis]
MFTSSAYLKKHTPENGIDRESYLSLLVDEYFNTSLYDAKCQVLANLSNFAYDPINYKFIRDVGVLDIFLFVVKNETDTKLLHYATSGICNLCVDTLNVEYILSNEVLDPLTNLLNSEHNETVADVLTTLFYLQKLHSKLIKPQVIEKVLILTKSNDKIISNLATILLNETDSTN